MSYPSPFGARTERERRLVERARTAAAVAEPHAARHDREASFPVEGLASLAESGYLAAVAPSGLGGEDAGVTEYVLGSLALAPGDASLALVVAMHATLLGRVRDAALWPAPVLEKVMGEVARARAGVGALINSLTSEPELGSPSRGGLPATRAEYQSDGSFRVSGRKSFCSGAPVLRWGVFSAAVAGRGERPYAANFLIPVQGTPGISIEPAWDVLGMRATGSDALVLDNVAVPADAELPRPTPTGNELPAVPHDRAWALCVSAVYLGVAEAARNAAFEFARTRRPTALSGQSISSVPHIRRKAGEIDLLLYQARASLVGTARAWDAAAGDDAARRAMESALAVAKTAATNAAVQVAELAMRLVGGSSLDRSHPLERHYRDVRGGLHHPPQDDLTLESLARDALD